MLNTTLFHAVDDEEGYRKVTGPPNLATLVFVPLNNHAEEFWEAAKGLYDHPQSLSAHCVKRNIQSFFLLPVFLLKLSEDDHHVCGAPVGSEPTLSFW